MWKKITFLLALCFTLTVADKYTAGDCRDLGFIKGQLMCSSCDKLNEFGLDEIKPHCTECCTMDTETTVDNLYAKAILEVCTCKFRAYPQIEAFIKSGRPAKFPNLQIKYVRGLDPTIKMLDASGQVKETLSITKWNTDTVEEFFETHLEKAGSTGSRKHAVGGGKSAYSVVEERDDEVDDGAYLKTNRI